MADIAAVSADFLLCGLYYAVESSMRRLATRTPSASTRATS